MSRQFLPILMVFSVASCCEQNSEPCTLPHQFASASSIDAIPDASQRGPESNAPNKSPTIAGRMTFVPSKQSRIAPISAQNSTTSRVMIVSFDGLRPDAISETSAPTLWSLIEGGSYQPAALAEIPAVTLPNHSSMLTGLSILSHGVFINITAPGRIEHPTVFDVAREHDVSTGFFVNKGKLGYLCADGDADFRRIKGDVDVIADECADAIRDNDLRLIFLHFGEPDGAGHAHGWLSEPYMTQVTRADAALQRILDVMEDRGIRKETLLIITADHGGHDKTHGFPIPDDQHVPFILNGPGIAEGRRLTTEIHPMDVAASALSHLGLPTTIARDGRVIIEAQSDFAPTVDSMDEPAILFTSICGPMPWFFMTATLVSTLSLRRKFVVRR